MPKLIYDGREVLEGGDLDVPVLPQRQPAIELKAGDRIPFGYGIAKDPYSRSLEAVESEG